MSKSNAHKPISAKAKPQSSINAAAAAQEDSISPRSKVIAANKAKTAAVKAKLATINAEAKASKVIVKSPAAAQEEPMTPKSKVIAANKAKAAAVKAKATAVKAEAAAQKSQNTPHKKYTTEEREATLLKVIQHKIESNDFSSLKSYIAEYNENSLDKDKLSTLLSKKNKFITHKGLIKYENKSALDLALFNNISTELILSNVNATDLEKMISVGLSYYQDYYAIKSTLETIHPNSLATIFKTHYKVGLNILDIALNKHPSKSALILDIIDKVSPEELAQAIVNSKDTLGSLMRENKVATLIINKLSAVNVLEIQNNEGLNILDIALDTYSSNSRYDGRFYHYGNNSTQVEEMLSSIIEKIPTKQLAHLLFNMGPKLATILRSNKISKLIIDKFSAENILEIQSKEVLNTLITLNLYSCHYDDPVLIKMISTMIDNISYTELTQALANTKPDLVTFMRSQEIAKSIINKTPAENIPELLFTTTSNDNFIPCLEYCMSLKTKVFNINAFNQIGERLIDIVSTKYAQTKNKSLLETINNLRKFGSVEPKVAIQINTPKNDKVLDDIDLKKLDSSDKNKEITREILGRIDKEYQLTEAQIGGNISWFKTQDLSGWFNNSWDNWGGRVYTISEVVDLLSGMRNVNDRLGINWDFKKVLATAIHIARTSDDKEMIAHLTHTLSDLKMCNLGKLINLASIFQVKFNKDLEEARSASIKFTEHEIEFLFQNVFDGLKSILESNNNKMAQAVKSWVFEVSDKEVARDNPEKWSMTTIQIHGLFNATLQEIITHTGFNCDTKHFKNLVDQIAQRINNIKSANNVSSPAINELRKLYILSKNLYFQEEFEKIVQNPNEIDNIFGNFSMYAKSYYSDLSGVSHSLYAKTYKKLSKQNIELAEQFLFTAVEYTFITQEDTQNIKILVEDPKLFDDELALLLANTHEHEEAKDRLPIEDEYKYYEPDTQLIGEQSGDATDHYLD